MSAIGSSTPLSSMLDNAFTKIDINKNKSLDKGEFKSFYEILKPGIAKDKDGSYQISEDQEFERMDRDGDGAVTRDEMQSTSVLMPASLCDESLSAMIKHLLEKGTSNAAYAAALLQTPEDPNDAAGPGTAATAPKV